MELERSPAFAARGAVTLSTQVGGETLFLVCFHIHRLLAEVMTQHKGNSLKISSNYPYPMAIRISVL